AVSGRSTYANYLSITPVENLDVEEIRTVVNQVRNTIHEERDRVRYVMNSFVLAVGTNDEELNEDAKQVAEAIGKVHVDVGNTACKVPLASDYIKKVEAKNRVGMKRKTCIC